MTPDPTDANDLLTPQVRRIAGTAIHGALSWVGLLIAFKMVTPPQGAALSGAVQPTVMAVALIFNLAAAYWHPKAAPTDTKTANS